MEAMVRRCERERGRAASQSYGAQACAGANDGYLRRIVQGAEDARIKLQESSSAAPKAWMPRRDALPRATAAE
eukprot:5828131-Pyramimonas_sp.AAC.1